MITPEQFKSLNEKERKVYTYVEANKEKAGYMNIRELAAHCEVSTATILRFIHKLGMESYKEFKYWCHQFDNAPDFHYHTKEVIECLQKMETPFFQERLQEAADMLSSTDFVVFSGIGNNFGIATYGARCFANNGLFAFDLNDPFYNIESLPENMILVVLSVSGETKEMIEIAVKFCEYKVPILCITANEDSTLGKMADLTLPYFLSKQRKDKTFDMSSQIPAISIIEKLAHEIYKQKK